MRNGWLITKENRGRQLGGIANNPEENGYESKNGGITNNRNSGRCPHGTRRLIFAASGQACIMRRASSGSWDRYFYLLWLLRWSHCCARVLLARLGRSRSPVNFGVPVTVSIIDHWATPRSSKLSPESCPRNRSRKSQLLLGGVAQGQRQQKWHSVSTVWLEASSARRAILGTLALAAKAPRSNISLGRRIA